MIRVGIFVGGSSSRMGTPKGLLHAPGSEEPLVSRAIRLSHAAELEPVLVGNARSYTHLDLDAPVLQDDPPGIGPLGGIQALLRSTQNPCLVWACDMPFVDVDVLITLRDLEPKAPIAAPRRDGRWEPLLARYQPSAKEPLATYVLSGARSLQGLLDQVNAEVVALPQVALQDWDEPSDLG